jgi:hypothetical protein
MKIWPKDAKYSCSNGLWFKSIKEKLGIEDNVLDENEEFCHSYSFV